MCYDDTRCRAATVAKCDPTLFDTDIDVISPVSTVCVVSSLLPDDILSENCGSLDCFRSAALLQYASTNRPCKRPARWLASVCSASNWTEKDACCLLLVVEYSLRMLIAGSGKWLQRHLITSVWSSEASSSFSATHIHLYTRNTRTRTHTRTHTLSYNFCCIITTHVLWVTSCAMMR